MFSRTYSLMTTAGSSEKPRSMRSSTSQPGNASDGRNFEQEVNVLGKPRTAAKHERQSADEPVANRPGVEGFGHRLDRTLGIARQETRFNAHGVL